MADLKKERESLIAQRDNAFSVYHQSLGAIALIDYLIEEEKKSERSVTLDEFKDAIGAKSVEVVPLGNE